MKTNINFSFQNKEDSKLFPVHLELEAIFRIQMLIRLWNLEQDGVSTHDDKLRNIYSCRKNEHQV